MEWKVIGYTYDSYSYDENGKPACREPYEDIINADTPEKARQIALKAYELDCEVNPMAHDFGPNTLCITDIQPHKTKPKKPFPCERM